MSLDPTKLTPLAREVTEARDELLGVLAGLHDDRKAIMALEYATASYLEHIAAISGHAAEKCVMGFAGEVARTMSEGVMTAPIKPGQ